MKISTAVALPSQSLSFKILALCLLFLSPLQAFGAQTFKGTPLSAVTATDDHDSVAIDATSALYGSFQCAWTSLTGTINGTVQAQVSETGTDPWDNLSGTSMSLVGATDHNTVVISGVLTPSFVRLHYVSGGISGGALTCTMSLKE